MTSDLSHTHQPITDLFPAISGIDTTQSRLTSDQIDFFHANGYLAGIRLLNDDQIAVLREQLQQLIDPTHAGHDLFYEFHSNESTDPSTILFHALGAWRIAPGFHDLLCDTVVEVIDPESREGRLAAYDPAVDAITPTLSARVVSTLGFSGVLVAALITTGLLMWVSCGDDFQCGTVGTAFYNAVFRVWFVLQYIVLWLGPAGRLPGAR